MRRSLLTIGFLILLLPLAGQRQKDDVYKYRKHFRISTGADELAAVPFEDGSIAYTSQNISVGASSPTDKQGRRLFTMYLYKPSSRNKDYLHRPFVTRRHEGLPSFTADFKTMVFCQMDPNTPNREYDPLQLFFSENLDGMWSEPVEFDYNDEFVRFFSPALSPDGKYLFFAADYEEGYGGFDLYRSRLVQGMWTKPENLGPGVNTEGNEIYPFFHPSKRLYFSSDGHDNKLNGYDIFETRYMNGEWARAVKMPPQVNSSANDYHVWFAEDMRSGYLTTDRRSGSRDIWTFESEIPVFERPQPIKKTYYTYKIYDRKLDTVDHTLFRYSWTINDTLTIPGHEIIYRFPEPGTYVCKLNVYDIQLDTLVEGQTVKTLNINLHEQAVITAPDTVQVNEAVNFDARQTYLPGVDIESYAWDFGDGLLGTGPTVRHSFARPGKYKVILGVKEREQRGNRNRAEEEAEETPDAALSTFKLIVVLAE